MLKRAFGLLGNVDLAFFQALDKVAGSDVDKLDGVSAIEDRVWHRLANADAGDLRHDVVQAFDVLDIERGIDVDAACSAALRRRDSVWGGGCPAHWCERVRRPGQAAVGGR